MPQYPYPYVVEPTPSWWVIALHGTLLCVALIPIVGLFIQSRRPATTFDACLWIGGLVCAPIPFVIVIGVLSEHSQPFVLGLLVLTEVIFLLAIIITTARLLKQGNAVNAFVVVGGLLGLIFMVAMLLPAVPSAREAARRMQCTNNLKQLMLGVYSYHEHWGELPPPVSISSDGIATSWRIATAPYIELGDLANRYDRTQTWDSDANLAVARSEPWHLTCPSNTLVKDEEDRYYTAYAIPVGPESAFSSSARRTLTDCEKDSSTVMAIVEACGRNIVWTKPEDVDMSTLPIGVNLPGQSPQMSHGIISSTHPGGANAVMLDGSVRFVRNDIAPETLRQLLSARKPVTASDDEPSG